MFLKKEYQKAILKMLSYFLFPVRKKLFKWRHDYRHNDTHHNYKKCDNLHKNTQHNDQNYSKYRTLHNVMCHVMCHAEFHYAECCGAYYVPLAPVNPRLIPLES
jgi:hypothetical protein